jgi:hypothetical protein
MTNATTQGKAMSDIEAAKHMIAMHVINEIKDKDIQSGMIRDMMIIVELENAVLGVDLKNIEEIHKIMASMGCEA